MNRVLYLIDGVSVPRKTFVRRQIWGEHAGAKFQIWSPREGYENVTRGAR